MKLKLNQIFNNLVLSHTICIIIYSFIYYHFYYNINYHWIFNDNIPIEEYQKNKIINSLYLSINIQTTTGNMEYYPKSNISKLVSASQMYISTIISLGAIFLSIND